MFQDNGVIRSIPVRVVAALPVRQLVQFHFGSVAPAQALNMLSGCLMLSAHMGNAVLIIMQGRTVSFKNCVIIMTSNLGSADIFAHLPSDSKADLKERVMAAVRSHFRPEFVNRVDEFIVFEPLVEHQIRSIVGLRAAALVERVAAQRLKLTLGDSALDYLAQKVSGGADLLSCQTSSHLKPPQRVLYSADCVTAVNVLHVGQLY